MDSIFRQGRSGLKSEYPISWGKRGPHSYSKALSEIVHTTRAKAETRGRQLLISESKREPLFFRTLFWRFCVSGWAVFLSDIREDGAKQHSSNQSVFQKGKIKVAWLIEPLHQSPVLRHGRRRIPTTNSSFSSCSLHATINSGNHRSRNALSSDQQWRQTAVVNNGRICFYFEETLSQSTHCFCSA